VTEGRAWKRLFPVRFRHLAGDTSFSRWDWIKFDYRMPTNDKRSESCAIQENSIQIDGELPPAERAAFLTPMLLGSGKEAAERGLSLALIRPRNARFLYKPRKPNEIEEARQAYQRAARQKSFLDAELAELEPSPYDFRFTFEDDGGSHDYQNGDWETHAMFFKRRQSQSEAKVLEWMDHIFNEDYPRRGMAFAIGNQAKRPQTWQLLGVLRLDVLKQAELPF